MLHIDFKAPVEVTITFDDSDDEEIQHFQKEKSTEDSHSFESVGITNKNITQADNQKDKEISQNSDNCQHYCKNDNTVPCKSTVATKKRKLESSLPLDHSVENGVKHTVITNTHGKTHIIVAPPTNSSPVVDETNKINQYLDNSLKTISEHLILIIQAYQQFSTIEKNTNGLEIEPRKHFMAVKNYFYNLSYSAVVSIMVPQENDMLFVTRFLKDTLRLCKEKNVINITNEEQIFSFYKEMLEWAKQKQKEIPEIKFVNNKERNLTNVSDKSAHKINISKRNTSDDRNAHLRALLKTRSNTNVLGSSKNNTLPYYNTNIPNTFCSPNGHGNAASQTNSSLASVVPGISNTVTNAFPSSNLNVTYDLAHYNNSSVKMTSYTNDNLSQNQYHQVQQGLSQTTPSGQNLFQQSQGTTRIAPSAQNSYQPTQYNSSRMKHAYQNPFLLPHMQQGSAQALPGGNFSNMMNNFQNVPQNTIHTHFNSKNNNTNSAAQSHLREDRNGLNHCRTDLNTGNFITYIPTYQNKGYIQSRTDQQVQWVPNKPPPQYEKSCYWKNVQAQNSISTEQQPTQASPAAQRSTPIGQWQNQVEPQPLEVTRSISTDSGIVSPLPFMNTTGATNNNTEEEQPTPLITHVTSLNPKVSYNNEGECSVCCKTTKLKCLCLEKYYCSYVCQEQDWNNHSTICSTQKTQNRLAH